MNRGHGNTEYFSLLSSSIDITFELKYITKFTEKSVFYKGYCSNNNSLSLFQNIFHCSFEIQAFKDIFYKEIKFGLVYLVLFGFLVVAVVCFLSTHAQCNEI